MENNEISMVIDVKLDVPDKRPDSLRLKAWTRCNVKIEAIKCLPCFLRITFKPCESKENIAEVEPKTLSVSINVPGLSISLAASRTKQYSYGLFWTQSRRDCYIYFALETESSCRRHMKWIKKSIKNLELHRQIFLEQRRNSRGPGHINVQGVASGKWKAITQSTNEKQTSTTQSGLGPLPNTPNSFDANASTWSTRYSRVSDIYEEIFEDLQSSDQSRLSRRFSRTSIASGIYEEMKPSTSNFNAIVEEVLELAPPVPPLPPPRKRINTYETESHSLIGEIPRCNTNPESEMAKKKKYKNVFDNIFGSGRSKRAESVSENRTCSVEDFLRGTESKQSDDTDPPNKTSYESSSTNGGHKMLRNRATSENIGQLKRNSFSSPDLSKINLLDAFCEGIISDLLLNSFNSLDDLGLSAESLDESSILPESKTEGTKAESLESVNISQRIPNNFNFSACNTSKINLIGSNGAAPIQNVHKNKILVDDLTGYCIMAPIIQKNTNTNDPLPSTESTSSGYSTGSYCPSITEEQPKKMPTEISTKSLTEDGRKSFEESTIYENMLGSFDSTDPAEGSVSNLDTPSLEAKFSSHLYENLLTVKAAQELEQQEVPVVLSTSTPTDSPLTQTNVTVVPVIEEEGYYQTPRKSIISVDDKIPSYYPNSCDTAKMRRHFDSPAKFETVNSSKSTPTVGLRHLANKKLRHERKENLYISSPQKIIEQRQNSGTFATRSLSSSPSAASALSSKTTKSLQKPKKTAAHKISDGVYAVRHHINKKANGMGTEAGLAGDMKEQLQTELIHLAILQNIDFKFDDTKSQHQTILTSAHESEQLVKSPKQVAKVETENCFHVADSATRLLHKYAAFAKFTASATTPTRPTMKHHLQVNQTANTKHETLAPASPTALMAQSAKLDTPITPPADLQLGIGSIKKFASLPRFKRIDFTPLKMRINNVLQRNQQQSEI